MSFVLLIFAEFKNVLHKVQLVKKKKVTFENLEG